MSAETGSFYVAVDEGRFRASELTASPWGPGSQHGGPPSALLGFSVYWAPRRLRLFTGVRGIRVPGRSYPVSRINPVPMHHNPSPDPRRSW